jgi:L-alanine-DL-glutamate epimerase-like enolase superfamily enzyme
MRSRPAALPNFLIQEYQPAMLPRFNPWLAEPLRLENGHLVVPSGPGLGITLDEDHFARDVASKVTINLE